MRGAGIPEPAQKAAAIEGSGPPERRPADEVAVDVPTPAEEAAGSGPQTGGAAPGHKRGRPRRQPAARPVVRAAPDPLGARGAGAPAMGGGGGPAGAGPGASA